MDEEYGNILAEQDEDTTERFDDGTPKDENNPDHFPHPF